MEPREPTEGVEPTSQAASRPPGGSAPGTARAPGSAGDHARLPTRRDWAVAHDRRVHAATIARRLQPAAVASGGYASSRLRVRLPGQRERRPAAALVRATLPVDGVVREPPLLVVELAPADPGWWLAAGSREVWVLTHDSLTRQRADAVPVRLGPRDTVAPPGAGARALPVGRLLPRRELLTAGGLRFALTA